MPADYTPLFDLNKDGVIDAADVSVFIDNLGKLMVLQTPDAMDPLIMAGIGIGALVVGLLIGKVAF
jgi:hypothetical protein